jgi:hypothetical protein
MNRERWREAWENFKVEVFSREALFDWAWFALGCLIVGSLFGLFLAHVRGGK